MFEYLETKLKDKLRDQVDKNTKPDDGKGGKLSTRQKQTPPMPKKTETEQSARAYKEIRRTVKIQGETIEKLMQTATSLGVTVEKLAVAVKNLHEVVQTKTLEVNPETDIPVSHSTLLPKNRRHNKFRAIRG